MIAYLGLGSNLGDRFENIRRAIRIINELPETQVTDVSAVYETKPVGGPEQPDYFNAVLSIETEYDAFELLTCSLNIEQVMGRVRNELWGPRIIDVDILLVGSMIIESKDLIIPHPLMHQRAFVLQPLADIAPDVIHPVMGISIADLLLKTDLNDIRKREYEKLVD